MSYIVSTILVGMALSLFNLDEVLIAGFNEMFKTKYTTNVFWLVLVVVALLLGLIHELRN